jgi:hypothetical protein
MRPLRQGIASPQQDIPRTAGVQAATLNSVGGHFIFAKHPTLKRRKHVFAIDSRSAIYS